MFDKISGNFARTYSVLDISRPMIPRHALFLADPQSPSSVVGGRRRLAAKDVNERGPVQRLGEGKRVPPRAP